MSRFVINHEIQLETTRCYSCGKFWAYEYNIPVNSVTCPLCAFAKIQDARSESEQSQRRIYSLKGAITRLKRKFKSSIPLGRVERYL